MSIDEAEKAATSIGGFVSVEEGRQLYELARRARGSIIEIGSWKGRSTTWLAYGSRDGYGGMVFAIDPHAGSKEHEEEDESSTLDEFMRNIDEAGIGDQVRPLVMTSEEAHREVACPIGLLFLDGPSEAELVEAEVDRWSGCMEEGSVMAIHDTVSNYGSRKAAESMYLSTKYAHVQRTGTLTYATLVSRASVVQKLSDLRRLVLITVETNLGRFHYPAPIRRFGRIMLDLFNW